MRVKPAILSTLLLLTGCHQSIYEEPIPEPIVADTYISLQIEMEGSSLRAQQADWPGIDVIEWIYLYAFDTDSDEPGTIIPIGIPEEQQSKSPIQVTRPWRTSSGEKDFFIIANPSPDVARALETACHTSRTTFETVYRDTPFDFLDTDNFEDFRTNYWSSDRLAPTKNFIDYLAQIKTDPTQDNMYYKAKYGMVKPSVALNYIKSKKSETEFNFASKIMMTGEPVKATLTTGVSQEDAPQQNNVSFTITRTVAQVVVSEDNDGILSPRLRKDPIPTPLLRYTILRQEPTAYLLSKRDNQSGEMVSPAHSNATARRYSAPPSSHNDYRLWNYIPYGGLDLQVPLEKTIFSTTQKPYTGYDGDGMGECFLLGGHFIPESSQDTNAYTWENTPLVIVQVSLSHYRPKLEYNSVLYRGTGAQSQKLYTDYKQAFMDNNPAGTPTPSESSSPLEQVKLADNVITYPGARTYYVTPVNPETGDVQRNAIYRLYLTRFSKIGYSGIPLKDSPIPCDPDDDLPQLTGPISFPYHTGATSMRSSSQEKAGKHSYEIEF